VIGVVPGRTDPLYEAGWAGPQAVLQEGADNGAEGETIDLYAVLYYDNVASRNSR